METLIVVAQHPDEYHGRNHVMGSTRFEDFGSPPSNGFRDINCRTFQSGAGILPTPVRTYSTSVIKRAFSSSFSPKTPTPPVSTIHSEPKKHSKKVTSKSCSGLIPISFNKQVDFNGPFGSFGDDFLNSELWAGPAYSISPPPSSLPIPKFSVAKPKRTVSLDLPSVTACKIDLHPIAKSAPASPTRVNGFTPRDFFQNDESATKNLRRILNLDLTDE